MRDAKISSCNPPQSNKGAALLIILLFIVVAFSTFLASSLSRTNLERQRTSKTLEALGQAKQALIARAVLQGDLGTASNPRPGTLPCPDINSFGSSNSGYASGTCSADGSTSIGRLPWKTLGIEKLRDANGEPLWYAVSDAFRGAAPNQNPAAINSDSKGTLLLYAADGTSLITPWGEELAAIIFAPNSPLPGQDRIVVPNAPESYLESSASKNNASASGPFIAGPVKDSSGNMVVNDLALGISAKELIAALEERALVEAQNGLSKYALANGGKYPNPASAACNSSITNINNPGICVSDNTICVGRLPESALPPYAATWFLSNGWGRTIIYAVNKNHVIDSSGIDCSELLNVDGNSKQYVLIAPGTALEGQLRPSSELSDYFEDPANIDAWSADTSFSIPSTNSNDQIRSFP